MDRLISINLDGVLNNYNGDYDEHIIPPIRENAREFLEELSKEYRIHLYTSRDIKLTYQWLVENNIIDFIEDISNIKSPAANVILDDRAINFDGDFNKAIELIKNFKPYWQ